PQCRGQAARGLSPAMGARVLEKTRQGPPDGSTHWSTRKLAHLLEIHHNLVAKAWRRAGLQPHRFERYMQSDDPDFETKAADVIGLYVNPPQHAAVFAVDEKTAIQALDRLDPVLPLSPGRVAFAPRFTATTERRNRSAGATAIRRIGLVVLRRIQSTRSRPALPTQHSPLTWTTR